MPYGILAENVLSNFADERNVSAEPFCGNCLVGTLSSGAHCEIIAQNSFSGNGHLGAECSHIGVGAAYHQDLSFHIWYCLLLSLGRNRRNNLYEMVADGIRLSIVHVQISPGPVFIRGEKRRTLICH